MQVDDTEAPRDKDLEDKVVRLVHLKQEQERLKQEYEDLRDELVPDLNEAQFFIDPVTGEKKVAYRVAPENTVVDAELLASYVPQDVLDEVTVRKVVTDKFWQANKAGRIPDEVAARVVTLRPATPHVRFGDPTDLARRAAE